MVLLTICISTAYLRNTMNSAEADSLESLSLFYKTTEKTILDILLIYKPPRHLTVARAADREVI